MIKHILTIQYEEFKKGPEGKFGVLIQMYKSHDLLDSGYRISKHITLKKNPPLKRLLEPFWMPEWKAWINLLTSCRLNQNGLL